MDNVIIIAILIIIIGAAVWYVIRAKRKGAKCIGCPIGCNCSYSNKDNGMCCSSCSQKESE